MGDTQRVPLRVGNVTSIPGMLALLSPYIVNQGGFQNLPHGEGLPFYPKILFAISVNSA